MPKFLTFDAEKVARALRVRFPLMDEKILQEVVATANFIVDHLWHGREARIAAHGESWRALDAFAEAVAFAFNLESMNQTNHAGGTLTLISEAVHSVYCPGQEETTSEPPPGVPMPPSGRN